jgi:hypothetical protein
MEWCRRGNDLGARARQGSDYPGGVCGIDTLEHGRFGAFAIPTDAEAVTIRRRRTQSGRQTLIYQGMDGRKSSSSTWIGSPA